MKTLLLLTTSFFMASSFACDNTTDNDIRFISCKTVSSQQTLLFNINESDKKDLLTDERSAKNCMASILVEYKPASNNVKYKYDKVNSVLRLEYTTGSETHNMAVNMKKMTGLKDGIERVICENVVQ